MQTFKHFKGSDSRIDENSAVVQMEVNQIKSPNSLPQEIVSQLEARIAGEYNAHYAYRAACNWCKNANYKKAADYFEKEADYELGHAKMIQDYLTQWNIVPNIPPVAPAHLYTSLVHIIDEAYDIEYGLLLDYSSMQAALTTVHPATFNFIQKFVDIQNESVGEYSDLLNALCLVNVSNKLDILFFEGKYFK